MSATQNVVHRPAVSASPETLLEMQILSLHIDQLNQNFWGGAEEFVLTNSPVDTYVH